MNGRKSVPQNRVADDTDVVPRLVVPAVADHRFSPGAQTFVKASIGGNKVKCLVDTGSMISLSPVSSFIGPLQPPSCQTLLTVSGSPLAVHGVADVEVAFLDSTWTRTHRFIVAEIATGPILGVDFLTQHRMCVNFKQLCLEWGSHSIPLEKRQEPLIGRVILKEAVSCMAAEEVFVTAAVVDCQGQQVTCQLDCLFEPDESLVNMFQAIWESRQSADCLRQSGNPRLPRQSADCLGNLGISPNCLGNLGMSSPNCLGNRGVSSPDCLGNLGIISPNCLGNLGMISLDCLGSLEMKSPEI